MKTNYDIRTNKIARIIIITPAIHSVLQCTNFNTFKEFIIISTVNFFLTIFVIMIFTYWMIPKFIIQKKRLFLLALNTVLVLLIGGNINCIFDCISENTDFRNLSIYFSFLLPNILRLLESTAIILAILLTKKFYESQTIINKIEKERKENELKLLRSQLDPHFLFNNLNSFKSLIKPDNEPAKEYINKFSKIYRYLIETKDKDIVELQKEIDFAKNYIFLIKTRFHKSYHFTFKNNATNLDTKCIPTGAVQTLLENVSKHNKTTLKLMVQVVITITNDSLTVYNTKTHLKSEATSFGTGLENLKTRYKNLTDKTILIDDADDYFSVTIPVINLIKR